MLRPIHSADMNGQLSSSTETVLQGVINIASSVQFSSVAAIRTAFTNKYKYDTIRYINVHPKADV